jgi:hypothetical protein
MTLKPSVRLSAQPETILPGRPDICALFPHQSELPVFRLFFYFNNACWLAQLTGNLEVSVKTLEFAAPKC